AGQVVDQPGVHGAEENLPAARALTAATNLVEDPLHLGAAEVGVGDEPGARFERVGKALSLEDVAALRGTPALPDDRVVDRPSGRTLPEDRGLALIGNPDGGNLGRVGPGATNRLARGFELARPDLLGIVLDPAGARIDLAE